MFDPDRRLKVRGTQLTSARLPDGTAASPTRQDQILAVGHVDPHERGRAPIQRPRVRHPQIDGGSRWRWHSARSPGTLPEALDLADLTGTHLDLDDLLARALDRVMALLGADTAAVLLVDASGTELVARAARGIEEEVHQGIRIRIGEGFAGRIAAEGRAAIIDRIDESTVVNPILWRRGLQALVGVPLVAGNSTIGVLHVGSATARRFGKADIDALSLIADQVALAVQVRLLEAERDADGSRPAEPDAERAGNSRWVRLCGAPRGRRAWRRRGRLV